ncbi:MAG: phosphate ABC transporter ATP-binding protein [Nitrososphaerales archaeon]
MESQEPLREGRTKLTILKLEGVSKSFSDKTVLRKVTFDVNEGEIVSIIGPSGSGKTTLLRLIDLLDYPTSGRIIFDGIDANSSESLRHSIRMKIGMVFQQPILFDTNVYNNVAYGLRIRGVEEEKIKERVKSSLNLVGLSGFDKRKAYTLSGGEAQRVAIARVIVYQPELILLDEPTANLDPYNVAIIEEIISKINRNFNATIIMATHNMFQAKRLGKKVVFLLDGEVVEIGKVDKIFEDPQDRRTKSFIKGEMIY